MLAASPPLVEDPDGGLNQQAASAPAENKEIEKLASRG
jgi:hypothetical protein